MLLIRAAALGLLSGCACGSYGGFCYPDCNGLVDPAVCLAAPPSCDAGVDAQRDAGTDAGADAPADTGGDAGCDGASPCWERMSGLPAGCEIERARHPERIHVTDFESCGAGCTRGSLGLAWLPYGGEGWASGGAHYVRFVGYPDGPSLPYKVIVRTDGVVVDALRHPLDVAGDATSCDASAFAVGEGMAAFAVDYVEWETPDTARDARSFVFSGAIGSLVDATLVHTVGMADVGATRRIERIAVSGPAAAWEIHGGGHLQAVVDGSFVDIGRDAFHSRAIGNHILYEEQAGTVRLMHWTPGAGVAPYLDLTPEWTAWLATDGADITWVRLATPADTSGDLWSAPYVRDPAMLAPRRVASGVPPVDVRVGDGLAAFYEVVPPRVVAYRVVDLASGEVRRWALPAGEGSDDLFLVSAIELVAVTASATARSRFLYRIDPSTLPLAP